MVSGNKREAAGAPFPREVCMKSGSTTVLQNTFAGLERGHLDELRALAKRRTYPPKTVLIKQGDVGDVFYVIVEGRVAVVREQEDGEEELLAIRGPNEFFGEMGLLDDMLRIASCVTLTEVTLVEITEELFDRLVEESPAVAYAVLRRVLATARAIDKQAIVALQDKNKALQKAYADLQAAQAELVVKERMEREMELAAEVQRSLLPADLPQHPDYAYSALLKPARRVGGDFYDVFDLDETRVGLLMADVADKGFQAGLFMAMTRTLFVQASKQSLSPARVALAVHQGMIELTSAYDLFVTAFYGVLHRPSGRLTYVRAGHVRPLLFRPGRAVHPLGGGGRFLGMWEELSLEEYSVKLQPADRLLLFSDGVPDATNPSEEQFGDERLSACLASRGHLDAADLVQSIAADVSAWCQDAPPFDDLTLLVVSVLGEA